MVGVEARAVVPGHVQRGGSPSAYDRMLSTVFGVHAAQLIAAENYGQAVAMVGNAVSHNPLSEVAGKTKFVPADAQAVRAARSMGISLGDSAFSIENPMTIRSSGRSHASDFCVFSVDETEKDKKRLENAGRRWYNMICN